MFGGFYHNTFALMRECYADWAVVAPGTPGQVFDDVFTPQGYCTVWESGAHGWRPVGELDLPTDDRVPGVDPTELSVGAAVARIFELIRDEAAKIAGDLAAAVEAGAPVSVDHGLIANLADRVVQLAGRALPAAGGEELPTAGPTAEAPFGLADLALGAVALAIEAVRDRLLDAAAE